MLIFYPISFFCFYKFSQNFTTSQWLNFRVPIFLHHLMLFSSSMVLGYVRYSIADTYTKNKPVNIDIICVYIMCDLTIWWNEQKMVGIISSNVYRFGAVSIFPSKSLYCVSPAQWKLSLFSVYELCSLLERKKR